MEEKKDLRFDDIEKKVDVKAEGLPAAEEENKDGLLAKAKKLGHKIANIKVKHILIVGGVAVLVVVGAVYVIGSVANNNSNDNDKYYPMPEEENKDGNDNDSEEIDI